MGKLVRTGQRDAYAIPIIPLAAGSLCTTSLPEGRVVTNGFVQP
jgi:hypothetical protein